MKWLKKGIKFATKHWKITELKDKQIELIDNIFNGNDTIGLLPTGYGKSLCYLLPPLLCKKVMIIISPLIALMDDQKDSLAKKEIKCAVLHSNNKNRSDEIQEILNGNIYIVYMSPEYLVKTTDSEDEDEINFCGGMKLARSLYKKNMLGFLAVDESHCCSAWGNDFRPEYKEIKVFRDNFPDIPIMAVTATATTKVCKDIAKMLHLDTPILVKGSFDRPNINISIMEIPSVSVYNPKSRRYTDKMESNKNLVLPYIKKYNDAQIIIYIENKDLCEELASDLTIVGIKASAYHAGFSAKKREDIQSKFINNEYNIIISTTAFGMGIDMTIRCVIIIGCPKSIEEYYQQIGRAGRDNLACEAVLFFDYSKYIKNIFFLKQEKNPILHKVKDFNLKETSRYAYTTLCRRRHILEYFDEECNFLNCNNCDNCSDLVDITLCYNDMIKEKSSFINIKNKLLQPYMNKKGKLVEFNLADLLQKWKYYGSKNNLMIPRKFLIQEKKEDIVVDIYDKFEKLLV